MNTIIGGLLVLSLLSGSPSINASVAAYDIFRSKQQIVYVVKKEEESPHVQAEDISEMLNNLDDEARVLSGLLKEKHNMIAKVQTAMDLRAYTKTRLSSQQIGEFNRFSQNCVENNNTLNELMETIEEKQDMKHVQKEILHNKTDMDFVYKELSAISAFQKKAINALNDFLAIGSAALAVL